jgi:hypothetical protein
MSLKILDLSLEKNKIKELTNITDLYNKSYPTKWEKKNQYFNEENQHRASIDLEEYKVNKIFLGYLIDENKNELILDDNFIKLIFLRHNGLQNCICNQELYLENNKDKDTCKEQLYLNYYKIELEKLKPLIIEYENNECYIISNKEKKIEFVKKICETILWGYKEVFDCSEILKKNDLHPKTFKNYKQLVLGTRGSDWLKYLYCNIFFIGPKIMANYNRANIENDLIKICDKTVEFNLLLNKYANLASYYKKAPFIRFLLKKYLIMPYRRYPSVEKKDKNGSMVATLTVGPYNYDIFHEKNPMNKIFFNKFYNFTLYDDTNNIVVPPLLRSSITTTYTEFRDLLCYLNLPVFRSTINTDMLFFPNYDLHQRLLEIQGLPRNYGTYTGKSIDWKWFKEGEKAAKESIACFCQEYQEGPGYGIVPVEYVWYDIEYPDTHNIKKFIFLVVPFEELEHYTGSDIYKRDGKYYICNKDEVPDHMVGQLFEKQNLEHVDYIWYEKYLFINIPFSEAIKHKMLDIFEKNGQKYYCTKHFPDDKVPWTGLKKVKQNKLSLREKYIKYKNKYLNLKKLLQKIEK